MAIVAEDLTTKLDSVNAMLSAIGEDLISTLTGSSDLADVAVAEKTLDRISRHVQSKAWHFNTELDYPMTPDQVTKEIQLPPDVIRLIDVKTSGMDVTLRGQRLYNRADRTYEFSTQIEADVVILLEFDDLPEAVRQYVAIKAIRQYVDQMVPNQTIHTFTQQDELEAKAAMEEYEGDTADYNVLNNAAIANGLRRSTLW